MLADLFVDSGAEFSACGRYRGLLWRRWDEAKPPLVCILLNPSRATAELDDPTVTRCTVRAHAMGFGGVRILNIFTLRSTDPAGLKQTDDPVGPGADEYLVEGCRDAGLIICGWGVHGVLPGQSGRPRCDEVIELLTGVGHELWCFGTTFAGMPRHPLYVAYDVAAERFR